MGGLINNQIRRLHQNNRCTMLAVGPMSKNCVDATIEIANTFNLPLFLIASRRQVDSKSLGGGYVERWSTEEFARYVGARDKKSLIVLARDHGGPWQNESEKAENLSLIEAMASAKASFEADVSSGFRKIHIDPSVDIHNTPTIDQVLDRVFELYEFCWQLAESKKQEIIFEIGTEEQSGSTNSQDELEYTLQALQKFCQKQKMPMPTYVVIQGGTRVMEDRNVGTFGLPVRVKGEIPPEIQIPKMLGICKKYDVFMKAHNTDYLSDDALSWYPKLGIHAANIAPEFGVVETRAVIDCMRNLGCLDLLDEFMELSYSSGKWKKWMLPETDATDVDKSVLAGHYVFGTKQFVEIKEKLVKEASKVGLDIDAQIKDQVKASIMRYVRCFRLENLK